MKKFKKLVSLLLTTIMVLSMTMPVLAADVSTTEKGTGSFTITINDDTPGYVYGAYQIFKADLDNKTNTLSNIEWGSDIDADEAAKQFPGMTAKQVAESMESMDSETDETESIDAQNYADKFAACLKKNSNGEIIQTSKLSGDHDGTKYTISGLNAGYYLVRNESIPGDGSATRYILQVIADQAVTPKRDVLIKEKDIIDPVDGAVKVNEAPIGETVNFRVYAKLPSNYDKYDKYYYLAFTDYLTKGFDFVPGSVKVEIARKTGGTDEKPDFTTVADVTKRFYSNNGAVSENHNGKDCTKIFVGIENLKWIESAGLGESQGDYVVLYYSATLNKNAVVGIKGNPNYVLVEYSNDPNQDADGGTEPTTPNEPVKKTPTGVTPESDTNTFLAELTIHKVMEDGTTILPGAGFTLSGENMQVKLVVEESFEPDADGIYWLLKDKTYTTDAPVQASEGVESNEHLYESTTQKYSRVIKMNAVEGEGNDYSVEGIVGTNGDVKFTGLGKGKYTLEETVVPSGYNKCENITFEIVFTPSVTQESKSGSFSIKDAQYESGNSATFTDGGNGFAFTTTIKNENGSLLPSTGGIGTTIFYIVGGVLIVGAGILLVAKKRMSAK